MQLEDIIHNATDQDRGLWFDLLHPVTLAKTGIRFKIAGPDSATQTKARLQMVDDLAELADDEGRLSAEAREKARLNSLARCVLDWEISEDGAALAFSQSNLLRVLRAAAWLREQVDAFAGNRAAFMGGM